MEGNIEAMIHSIQQHLNLPFDQYLKLPGYSTSFLKREVNGVTPDFVKTDKMFRGSLVDAILTSPSEVDMSSKLYPVARDISNTIRGQFGDMFKQMLPQVSYTGTASYGGFSMLVKGRLDFELPKLAVIDLKITETKNIKALIKHMGYDNQMFLYCKFIGVTKAYLIFYCVPLKKCIIEYIDCSQPNNWWQERIIKFGQVNINN